MRSLLLLPLLAAAACVTEAPLDVDQTEAPLIFSACSPFGCGSNSPTVGGNPMYELNTAGVVGPDGHQLLGISVDGRLYDVRVEAHGDMVAINPADGTEVARGAELVGSALKLAYNTLYPYDLIIDDYDTIDYFADALAGSQTSVYYFSAARSDDAAAPHKYLCSELDDDGVPVQLATVVFAGDRYDAHTKDIVATGAEAADWFQVACAGHATAKMHLLGHGNGDLATLPERQALFRALVGDFCGDGTAYTVAGVPVEFETHNALFDFDHAAAKVEAAWTERGAACLSSNRLRTTHPDIVAEMQLACGSELPACDRNGYTTGAEWPTGSLVLTAVPVK